MANTYLIKEGGDIVAVHPQQDFTLQPGQTVDVLTDVPAMEFFERYQIRVDKRRIMADGVDTATVTITTNLPVSALGLLIEMLDPDNLGISLGAPVSVNVTIADGIGTHPIACTGPALIRLSPIDKTQFQAGRSILAEEA